MRMYCTLCEKEMAWEVRTDHNGETVAECPCGHFLKFPAGSLPPVAEESRYNDSVVKAVKEQYNEPKVPLWHKILRWLRVLPDA